MWYSRKHHYQIIEVWLIIEGLIVATIIVGIEQVIEEVSLPSNGLFGYPPSLIYDICACIHISPIVWLSWTIFPININLYLSIGTSVFLSNSSLNWEINIYNKHYSEHPMQLQTQISIVWWFWLSTFLNSLFLLACEFIYIIFLYSRILNIYFSFILNSHWSHRISTETHLRHIITHGQALMIVILRVYYLLRHLEGHCVHGVHLRCYACRPLKHVTLPQRITSIYSRCVVHCFVRRRSEWTSANNRLKHHVLWPWNLFCIFFWVPIYGMICRFLTQPWILLLLLLLGLGFHVKVL